MSEAMKEAMENSNVWKAETNKINAFIELCNRNGEIVPESVLNALKENRICKTILMDSKVNAMFISEL